MTVTVLKSKLHRIRVTEAKLDYTGSLTIDEDLMDAVGILNYEKLLVANVDNGERFETYAIRGPRGSGVCCLNGAGAQGRDGTPADSHGLGADARGRGPHVHAAHRRGGRRQQDPLKPERKGMTIWDSYRCWRRR